mmetsp:Transcript_28248/g.79747  ORF Transcript_28248/g.79747 Transcript_28248/m.79747 type:complete len:206 (+) Transcript_28248:1886-2503(+)
MEPHSRRRSHLSAHFRPLKSVRGVLVIPGTMMTGCFGNKLSGTPISLGLSPSVAFLAWSLSSSLAMDGMWLRKPSKFTLKSSRICCSMSEAFPGDCWSPPSKPDIGPQWFAARSPSQKASASAMIRSPQCRRGRTGCALFAELLCDEFAPVSFAPSDSEPTLAFRSIFLFSRWNILRIDSSSDHRRRARLRVLRCPETPRGSRSR